MAEWATVNGFVQFQPEEREANDVTVRDITVRPSGTDKPLIRITLWPEWIEALEEAGIELEEGDFVAADGQYEERTGQAKDGGKRTYRNLNSINKLAVTKGLKRKEREVVNKRQTRAKKSDSF